MLTSAEDAQPGLGIPIPPHNCTIRKITTTTTLTILMANILGFRTNTGELTGMLQGLA
ncbi:hypothetical protein E2C01_077817 [Portunus trituberculatus]|uniref:Uncharacterized protein n=1 Tax=Portunus trituberculatus TaxID=210409 RepID=A0A5B7IL57_PORTR|nr:hypothetical protein [Portunus trituberculatus]